MPLVFDIKMTVFIVQEETVNEFAYNPNGRDANFIFFYRPGHYEIIYDKKRIAEKTSNGFFSTFFGSTLKQDYYIPMEKSIQTAGSQKSDLQTDSQRKSRDPRIVNSQRINNENNRNSNISYSNSERKPTNNHFRTSLRSSVRGVSRRENIKQFEYYEGGKDNSFDYTENFTNYAKPSHHYSVKDKL